MPKIIMELEAPLPTKLIKDLEYLFADAMADFRRARHEPEQYVNDRYSGMSKSWRDAKIYEVQRRLNLASFLHNATLYPKYEP